MPTDAERLEAAQHAARDFLKNKKAATAEGRGMRTPLVITPLRALRDCFDMAKLSSEDVLVDLGSGTGVTLQFACKTYGCKAIGIEIDPALVEASRADIAANGLSERISVIEADFLSDTAKSALRNATVVFAFQTPQHGGNALLPVLQATLPPSARIVSYAFDWGSASTAIKSIETANWPSRPGVPYGEQRPAKAFLWYGQCRVLPRKQNDDDEDDGESVSSGSSSCSDEGGSGGQSRRRRRNRGVLGYIMSLLSRGSEEALPWLSWKVFDILFALLMLRLAKRFKFIRHLQELEVI